MQKRNRPESLAPTFPKLGDEAKKSLIPVSPEEPPSSEQVLSKMNASYGLSGSLPENYEVLHFDPLVVTFPNFFTNEECDRYVELGCSKEPVLSPTVGKDSASQSQRTSSTWHHTSSDATELVERVKLLLGVQDQQLEEPQTVCYKPGQFFQWHLDSLAPTNTEITPNQQPQAGNRVATALVYLNDLDSGATEFRDLGISIKPVRGTALLFFPSFGAVKSAPADIRVLHRGAPNEAGEDKHIAQLWIRQYPRYISTVESV